MAKKTDHQAAPDTLGAVMFAVLRLIAAACAIGAYYYFVLPPLNPRSVQFWFFLTFCFVCIAIALRALDFGALGRSFKKIDLGRLFSGQRQEAGTPSWKSLFGKGALSAVMCVLIAIPLAVLGIGTVISSVVFNATAYAEVITVEERDFNTDMPETKEITNIALMDTNSARMLGDRKLGALAGVVSQYVVSDDYTQINYKGKPIKITHLEYDGFFKWLNNKSEGIPGYIMVDTVGNSAEYYELEDGMIYAPSGYFSHDLDRKLRFEYPTKIFQNISFEADEDGKVFYVVSCSSPRVGLFGAMDENVIENNNTQPFMNSVAAGMVAPVVKKPRVQPDTQRQNDILPQTEKRRASQARAVSQPPVQQRKIKEIRIFYSDGTYETLVPERG